MPNRTHEPNFISGTTPLVNSTSRVERVPTNLLELLQIRAASHGNKTAFTFIQDNDEQQTLTFGELDRHARAIAAALQQHTNSGDRVLLVYPPGLDFICGFFGCVYAGVLPVPATYPKPRRPMSRFTAIASDCDATAALTTTQTLATLNLSQIQSGLQSIRWIASDDVSEELSSQWESPCIDRSQLAFLQYTSGSTSDPKGVMVTHENLLCNLEMIRQGIDMEQTCIDQESCTAVSWLPAYHDMGLINGILEPMYVGVHSVLMPPAAFLQRPQRWLEAISQYGAAISGAPNFAYDLCVNKITQEQRRTLDLSHWKVAFCGAEPIRAETLKRFAETFAECGFREEAFYPCYGLAEATLIATGGRGPSRPTIKRVLRSALSDHSVVDANGHPENQVQKLVGCGGALMEQEIIIADPLTRQSCDDDCVGEIWIKGPNVTRGYWNRPDEEQRTFAARLADNGDSNYLRTGDLGFISDGQLYITGRSKDVIIIRGRNHYPQDIEQTVKDADPALRIGAGAAFSIERDDQELLVVIHEIDRQHRDADFDQLIRKIRREISVEHELDVHAVVLIRQASLPMTTSGKAQRNVCRERFLAKDLKVVAKWIQHDRSKNNGSNGRHLADRNGNSSNGNGVTSKSAKPLHTDTVSKRVPNHRVAPPKFTRPDKPLRVDEIDRLAERIEAWLLDWMIERAAVAADEIDRDKPFAEYGLDSLTAVELSGELEEWLDVQLTPVVAWNYPTPAAISRYLAGVAGGVEPELSDETGEAQTGSKFDQLLAEIEGLSEDDAEAALNDELRDGSA